VTKVEIKSDKGEIISFNKKTISNKNDFQGPKFLQRIEYWNK
jgi:hypothetical protein